MSQSANLNANRQSQSLASRVEHSMGINPFEHRQASCGFFLENEIVDRYGPQFGAIAIAVFVVLKRHCNNNQQCWPSLKRLAKYTKLSIPTVLKGLRKLESQGLITRQRRQSSDGDPDTTLYTLTATSFTGGSQKNEQGYQAERGRVLNEMKDRRKRDLYEGYLVKEKPSGREEPPVAPQEWDAHTEQTDDQPICHQDLRDQTNKVLTRITELTDVTYSAHITAVDAIQDCLRSHGIEVTLAYLDWVGDPASGLPFYNKGGRRSSSWGSVTTPKSLFKSVHIENRMPRVQAWLDDGCTSPASESERALQDWLNNTEESYIDVTFTDMGSNHDQSGQNGIHETLARSSRFLPEGEND